MKAYVIDAHTGPTGLVLRDDVPDPEPGPGRVVIEVAAAALNRADLLQTKGLYPAPPGEHEIPGLDVAGHVAEIGPDVSGLEPGQRVAALVSAGGFAERVAVPAAHLIPIPDGMPLTAAAGLAECSLTVFDALRLQGGLDADHDVLVHAGGSGIGTAAIPIVHAFGGRVAVTCSTGKLDRVRDLGPDLVIDYRREDFVERIGSWTGGRGVDLVLDTVGGDYVTRNLRAAATGARVVVIGLLGGADARVQLGLLLRKRLSLIGSVLRPRGVAEKSILVKRFLHELGDAVRDGTLRPVIDRVYPFDELAAALSRMADNANVGKLVVTLKEDDEGGETS